MPAAKDQSVIREQMHAAVDSLLEYDPATDPELVVINGHEYLTSSSTLIPTKENPVSTMTESVTDAQIDKFLQEAGANAPALEKTQMGLLLRTRRATRHLEDGVRNAAVVGKHKGATFLAQVKASLAADGVVASARFGLKGLTKIVREWIGLGNILNLAVATQTGRNALRWLTRPIVVAWKVARALLGLNSKVNEKVTALEARGADKFDRIDKAFNVRKHADLNSWAMCRYRGAATLAIITNVTRKAAPKLLRTNLVVGTALFLLTDRKTAPMIKSAATRTWTWLKGVTAQTAEVVTEVTTEVTAEAAVEASTPAQPKIRLTNSQKREARKIAESVAQSAVATPLEGPTAATA